MKGQSRKGGHSTLREEYIDYSYALDFLKRLNAVVRSDDSLSSLFVFQGADLWQSYQSAIFGDVKSWSRRRTFADIKPGLGMVHAAKIVCSSLFIFTVSFIAAVVLLITRRKILVFTEDKTGRKSYDFRLRALYEALETREASFVEVVHTLSDRTMRKNLVVRKRPVIYLEALDICTTPFIYLYKRRLARRITGAALEAFNTEEKRFAQFLLVKYGSAKAIFKIRFYFFSLLLTLSNVRCIFSIDDTRHYNELMLAARQAGVETVAIQHGHFTKYHPGWLKQTDFGWTIRPDKLILWSQYWKDELIRLGTYFKEDELVVGGPIETSVPVAKENAEHLTVLLPYETEAPKESIKEYIARLINESSVELVFKIREDMDKSVQLSDYGIADGGRITVVRSVAEILPRTDVVAGTYSTFLYDMVALEKPVAILETSIDYGEGMVANGLATLIKEDEDPVAALRAVAREDKKELSAKREQLLGSGSKRLQDTLQDIITSHV